MIDEKEQIEKLEGMVRREEGEKNQEQFFALSVREPGFLSPCVASGANVVTRCLIIVAYNNARVSPAKGPHSSRRCI